MIIEADLTWIDGRFESGVQVSVEKGVIAEVMRDRVADQRLSGAALLPGFVNAHSHAFQRGLRGRGETFVAGAGSFWSWREAMYELVESMDVDRAYALSRQAFSEMLAAGITTVGEFHYLRHAGDDVDFALDDAVLRAAGDVGIRIVLLAAHYVTGGFNAPLAGGQRRFDTRDQATYWEQVDALASRVDGEMQRVGVVAHSIRAVAPDGVAALADGAAERSMVLHMHLEEQPREIEECRATYGKTPMACVLDAGAVSSAFTAVHGTHTNAEDFARFDAAGGRLCVCPLTEANLGDGLPDLGAGGAGRVCLGTDSNARISMIEEMRWLEYGQRLRTISRGALLDGAGAFAPHVIGAATANGAAALGLDAGRIAPGAAADLVAIDLEAPALAGAAADTLAAALVCGAENAVVRQVWTAGQPRLARG